MIIWFIIRAKTGINRLINRSLELTILHFITHITNTSFRNASDHSMLFLKAHTAQENHSRGYSLVECMFPYASRKELFCDPVGASL